MKLKSSKRLISMLLSGVMLLAPLSAFAYTGTSPYMSKTYTHQDKFTGATITHGIDVSKHNGTLDWNVIKNAGTDFAIIRAAYRGYASEGTLCKDTYFEQNMQGAASVGMPVGVYIYSQAVTEAEAIQEANYILNIVKGYSFNLPIVFDYEFASVKSGRLDSAWSNGDIDKADMTANTLAFCNTIKKAGYKAMVYANKSFLTTNIDHVAIENAGYEVWLAHYTTSTSYNGDFKIWQYTSSGTIDGIDGKVFDANFMYNGNYGAPVGASVAVADQIYDGSEVRPAVEVTYAGNRLYEGMDYTLSFSNNNGIGTATATITGLGTYAGLVDKVISFKILPKKVDNLKIDSVSDTSATVSWDTVSGAGYYQLQTIQNGKWTNITTSTTNMATVSNLPAGCKNFIRVAAVANVSGVDYIGEYCSYATAVTNVGQVKITSTVSVGNAITINWQKQDAAGGYEIYQYNYSTKKYAKIANITDGNKSSYKVKNLSPNKKYKFQMRAYTTEPKSFAAYSSAVTTYTSPNKPTIKSGSSPSSRKLKATWSKMSGATGFQVMWSTTSNFSSNYKTAYVKSATATSKTVTTAQSKRYYYIKVRAYKTRSGKKYYSSWSKTKTVKVK